MMRNLLFALVSFSLVAEAADNPNIILILADDMGVGEVSHNGGIIPTPALDQMAEQGMRFTDAHTSSSVCTPTRYGILTGRYNWRSRLKSGVLTNVNSAALMDPKRPSIGSFLQKNGYHSACVGKWHLGADWQELPNSVNPDVDQNTKKRPRDFASWKVDYKKTFRNGPVDIGFDEAFFILSSLDMPPYLYLRNDRAVEIPTVNRGFPHNEYNDYQRVGAAAENFDPSDCLADFASESRSYIKQRANSEPKKPFFLYVPLNSPHTPVRPGKLFKGKYPQYSWYADFVAETDWVVGEILAQLKESDIDDDTLVIFTADNGFAPYVEIPKMFEAGYKPSGKWRGSKASVYEGGHRVPFVARWPGQIEASKLCDTTICTTDFFATFADIIGAKEQLPDSAAEDSFSFLPCLKGASEPIRPFTVHHSISGKFAIRKGPWKLILATNGGGGWKGVPGGQTVATPAKFVQLYNLANDPGETANLENENPDKVEELIDDLAKAMADGRTTPGKQQSNEGWPYRDKRTLEKFPQLKQP